MTLTYRGKKYVQLQGAGFDATKKAQLTYRGLSYTKWAQGFTSKPRRKRGFFIPITERRCWWCQQNLWSVGHHAISDSKCCTKQGLRSGLNHHFVLVLDWANDAVAHTVSRDWSPECGDDWSNQSHQPSKSRMIIYILSHPLSFYSS